MAEPHWAKDPRTRGGEAAQGILAIDLGTSGPKVGLVSFAGEVLQHAFRPVDLRLLSGGGAEQVPDQWWEAVVDAAREVLGVVGPEAVGGICCTSQWSGTVAVNRDGRPLCPAIIWMDSRGSPDIEAMVRGPVRVSGYDVRKIFTWIRLTGGAPGRAGKDPLAHIRFIQRTRPDIYRQTHMFLEPKDYLNHCLTGLFAASFDSIALHWVTDNRRIDRIAYHPGLLKLAGIDGEKLPPLKKAVDVLGPLRAEAAGALGLPPGTPVVMGTPDVPSAAIGAGAVRDFEGHLYIGTSAWLTCHVPFKKTDLFHNMASLPAAVPGRYFVANEQETAGACLSFVRDFLLCPKEAGEEAYRLFDRLAEEAPPGSGGLLFTPWLYGERTPVEDHTLRGGLVNLSLRHTRAHLVRAVLEGVAFNARWLLQHVEAFIKRPMDPIRMIGGGAQSDVWCQIHADVLNRTILQVRDPILANLRGAGLLGAAGLGHAHFEDISERVPVAATFRPNPETRRTYDALFREFLQVYRNNRRMYRRLNREEA